MAIVKLRGYEFNAISIRDSYTRRAQKLKNNIINNLRRIGLTEDDIEIELEPVPMRKNPASVSWYVEGFHLHYSYKACDKYIENLYVVSKLLELEVTAVLEGEKTIDQFITDFSEDKDVEKERLAARELLGVESDSLDMVHINNQYKRMAKHLHPDMPNGDHEKFKALNRAHKILKRELT